MKISDWRKSLDIIAKYSPEGEDESFIFEAEHDIIYTHLSAEEVPEDSPDGKILDHLGWHLDEGLVWARFV